MLLRRRRRALVKHCFGKIRFFGTMSQYPALRRKTTVRSERRVVLTRAVTSRTSLRNLSAESARGFGRRRSAGALAAAAVALAGCGASHERLVTTARSVTPIPTVPPPPPREVAGGDLGTQTSLGGVAVPINRTYFHLTNMWLAKRNGIYIDVYAGASARTPRRGALIVNWTNPNIGLPSRNSGLYVAPPPAGPLTLTDVRADLLYFRYVGGGGTFDLRTRRFALGRQ